MNSHEMERLRQQITRDLTPPNQTEDKSEDLQRLTAALRDASLARLATLGRTSPAR